MKRRHFLDKISTGILTATIIPSFITCSNFSRKQEIGIMMNTVDSLMTSDYEGTLQKLKDIGYTYVEGKTYGKSLDGYAETLKATGLKSVGHGGALAELVEAYEDYLRVAEKLDQKYIVCYYPWMVANQDIDSEKSFKAADKLNKLGKRIKASGFGFCWHPHNFEFKDLGEGHTPFKILMEHTDPQYVSLQMDTYWMARAGQKPDELLKKYPERTKMLHLKDIDNDDNNACVGSGNLNFEAIIKQAKLQKIRYLTIEVENNTNPLSCVEESFTTIKNLI